MQLKTYAATDLASALARARAELGPDALVLATREVAGRLGLTSVEVTVAIERAPTAPADPDRRSLLERLNREVERPRGDRDRVGGGRHEVLPAAPRPKPDGAALEPATRALIESGLSTDLATRFARIAGRGLGSPVHAGQVARAAERGIRELVTCEPLSLARRCLMVVGPPGSGKTTTVAKLAARITSRSARPVVFAAADCERIGALEQAEALSRCTGARTLGVESASDLKPALDATDPVGTVLIDTPGVGAADDERLAFVRELRDAVPHATVAVLLPAGLHHAEAAKVLARFAGLRPSCVAFSRVDDGGRIGELVTALAPSRLPLAFLTTGHAPPDLEDASPRALAALMLRNGLPRRATQEIPA